MPKYEIDTPALYIDLDLMEANIARMADHFAGLVAALRPHAKTHKCPILAHKQIEAGAIGVCCAKLGEAEVFAMAGIRDILITSQIIGVRKITRLVNLAGYTNVIVVVDDAANVANLDAAARAKGVRLRVLVEVDIGRGRCGTNPGEPTLELARTIMNCQGLKFEGLMGYEGHTVMIPDFNERKRKTEKSLKLLVDTKSLLEVDGIPVPIVSSGGTGTYMITGQYPGITEVQTGSYVTMDTQYRDKVGIDFNIAVSVLSTVISVVRPGVAIMDAGWKTLTTEFGLPKIYQPEGWELTALSEEHGFLRQIGGPALEPGDKVEIYPSHGCTTINLHDIYFAIRRGIVEAIWPIAARGKIR